MGATHGSEPRAQLRVKLTKQTPTMSSPTVALPASLYSSLLLKHVTVLELTQKSEGTVTPQAKQAILHAVRSHGALLLANGELNDFQSDE